MTEKTPDKMNRKIVYKLKQTRLHAGESRIRWWFAEIEEGTPYEELFKPVYWDVHGYKFQIGDLIDCSPDEGHYRAWLEVVGTGVGGIRIEEFLKRERAHAAIPVSLTSQYKVEYAGRHHKWRVIRLADRHVESSGFDNEGDANRWLADNIKALSMNKPKDEAA